MERFSKLQEDFAELVKKTGKRLVIFIDDLDRLNPESCCGAVGNHQAFCECGKTVFLCWRLIMK